MTNLILNHDLYQLHPYDWSHAHHHDTIFTGTIRSRYHHNLIYNIICTFTIMIHSNLHRHDWSHLHPHDWHHNRYPSSPCGIPKWHPPSNPDWCQSTFSQSTVYTTCTLMINSRYRHDWCNLHHHDPIYALMINLDPHDWSIVDICHDRDDRLAMMDLIFITIYTLILNPIYNLSLLCSIPSASS